MTSAKTLIRLGLLLMAAALLLIAYNLAEGRRAGQSAHSAAQLLEAQLPQTPQPDYRVAPAMEMPTVDIDGVAYIGTLSIPTLDLALPVTSQWSYDNLKLAPCRYAGSAYLDDLVIAAHNYPAHFAGLPNLAPGDLLHFTDADGNLFNYEVAALETLAPDAVEEMCAGDYALTLFTCDLSGTHRVTVRCDRAEGSSHG